MFFPVKNYVRAMALSPRVRISIVILFCLGLNSSAQCTFTSSVPYFQSFTSLPANNQLPNCWAASNLGSGSLTYTSTANAYSGQQCAAFFHQPGGTNYFYTNGIQLYAGVIYSVGLFYRNDNTSSQNWSDLSILLGAGQTTTGLISLASTNGPASTASYLPLSNTFSISSSGIYYLAIRATVTPGFSEYLYVDDIFITIPCTGVGTSNVPSVSILVNNGFTTTSNSQPLCLSGISPSTLIAMGAHTYTWVGGSTSPTAAPTLTAAQQFNFVTGTDTITGCTGTASFSTVYPMPNMSIFSLTSGTAICKGQAVTLGASGASSYTWSTGATAPSILVYPTLTAVYSVTGTLNSTGCKNTAAYQVVVSIPTVSVTVPSGTICGGTPATVSAGGTLPFMYMWFSNSFTTFGNPVVLQPQVNNTYTLIGTLTPFCRDTLVFTIPVIPSPSVTVAGDQDICAGENVVFTALGAGNYIWSGSNILTAGNNATVSPPGTSAYTVAGTAANGCTAATLFTVTVNECAGIHDRFKNAGISVYPNPCTSCELIVMANSGNGTLSVFEANGRIVFKANLTGKESRFPLSDLPAGLYYGKIEENGSRYIRKIVIGDNN
jgi:hypothetical protein